MSQPQPFDPSLKFGGLVPRYVRERQAAALERARLEAEAAAAAAAAPRPDTTELLRQTSPVDAVTTDLRRRLGSEQPAGSQQGSSVSGSVAAGIGVTLALLVNAVATALSSGLAQRL